MNWTDPSGRHCWFKLQHIEYIFFFQSRTPALVFEHVNNTDFKVGAKSFLYSVKPVMETSFLGIPVVFPYTCVCMWWRNIKRPVLCLRCQKVNHLLVLSSITGTFPQCEWCDTAVCLFQEITIKGLMTLFWSPATVPDTDRLWHPVLHVRDPQGESSMVQLPLGS